MENLVVSLELAKKLKEAGFPEESTFYWANGKRSGWVCVSDGHCEKALTNNAGYGEPPYDYYLSEIDGGTEYSNDDDVIEKYAAPTAEEILRKLPPSITVDNEQLHLTISDDRDWIEDISWDIDYSKDGLLAGGKFFVRTKDGFAGACAGMWLRLAENNLLPTSV